MSANKQIVTYLGVLFLMTEAMPLSAQTEKKQDEIQLNKDVVKMIQFDFNPKQESQLDQLLEAPLEKEWMRFKEDLSMPRSMIDSVKVKKIKGYIRAEPYTIWTKFGENPIYDVMPTIDKKWTIHWKINPFRQYKGEYGRETRPAPGRAYLSATSPVGPAVSLSLDFNKLLYENLSKRGRAIKHNRTHATAWKKYANYLPTKQDHAGLGRYITANQTKGNPTDTIQTAVTDEELLLYDNSDLYPENDSLQLEAPTLTPVLLSAPLLPIYSAQPDSMPEAKMNEKDTKPKVKRKENQRQDIPDYQKYIRQKIAEDSIRRQEFLRKDKARNNSYDVEKQVRQLKELQN